MIVNTAECKALLDTARRYGEEGKPLHAGQIYRRVMRALPEYDEPYLQLAGLALAGKNGGEAMRLLREGSTRCGDPTRCRVMLADLTLQRGECSAAVESLAPLIAGKDPQVHYRLAIAFLRLGRMTDAELAARRAVVLDGRLADAQEILGEVLLATQRPGEATVVLRRAVRIDPWSARRHRLLGQALLRGRNVSEALDAFVMAAELDPEDAQAWLGCGEAHLRLRHPAEAELALRRAVELDPGSADAHTALGELFMQKGDMENALSAFAAALRRVPGHQRALDGRLHARMRSARLMDRLAIFVVSMVMMTCMAAAQPGDPQQAALLFDRGLREYESGRFPQAAAAFDGAVRAHPSGERVTAALIMWGKALYWIDENLESARVIRTLLADHPESRYAADAHYLLGGIYRRIGRSEDAMGEVLRAWEMMPQPEPPRLAEDIITIADTIASSSLSRAALQRFLAGTTNRERRAFLRVKIAENEAAAENTLAARLALDSLLAEFPLEASRPRVRALRNRLAERSDVHLGVLLPLMHNGDPTAAKEIAQDVYDGIRFAVDRFTADPDRRVNVTIVPFDTERDPVIAARGVRSLAADEKVVGIIGPVFSSSAVGAARAAEEVGVPLITPTANANGIAGTGPNVFQANPDYEMRGKAMAQYAIRTLGFKRVAVLAPSDSYGRFLAQAFADEVKKQGGQVLATEWYERKASDLTKQLRAIRRAGLHAGSDPLISFGGKKRLGELMKLAGLGVPVKKLDSLMAKGATVSVSSLVGPDAVPKLDSLGINVVYNDVYLDSLDIPVTTIDGLYLPIGTPEEIGVVTSQIVYFNLHAQLLGSGEWNALEELDANRRYCSGIVFESDSYADSILAGRGEWAAGYMAAMKRPPTKHTLYGYDAAGLLLSLFRSGSTTRAALRRSLGEVSEYQGLHARIGFSAGRVNTWLPILQFDGRNVLRVDEIKTE